ncbi:MAG: cell division protein FtsQ [Thiotrichales bacterium]|nr:MAG: cell division protein FtsQ [Thiotrichales bacterium]
MKTVNKKRSNRKTKRPQATARVTKRDSMKAHFSIAWKPVMWATLLLIPVVAISSGYFWIQNPENLTIKSVEVTGDLSILNKKQLEPIIESYAKTNLYLLDVEGLEKKIESNPWVHSASMTHVWPDKLTVRIYEQKPVAYWGDKAMLAENGEIIDAVLEDNLNDLPLLYSPENKGRNMASGFLKIRKMMKGFPIKLVEFKEDARGSWKIKLENGMTLKVGREHQEKRLRRFMVVYQQSLKTVIEKISVVDLRYTNGLAVQWKKGLSSDSVFKG